MGGLGYTRRVVPEGLTRWTFRGKLQLVEDLEYTLSAVLYVGSK